tara:strand:+ start:57 stop:611 length:555 start_codon:yes stop_codon:yes gene_type:complete
VKFTEKIKIDGGGFYLQYAQFLERIGYFEKFGTKNNQKFYEMVKNQKPYRDGKKGGLLERGKFYIGTEDASFNPHLYYAVPLGKGEKANSRNVGIIAFDLPTIEQMRETDKKFAFMRKDEFNGRATDSTWNYEDEWRRWDMNYMTNNGIEGMFTGLGGDFYGDYNYRFWEIPDEPELGLMNWWW